MEEPHPPDCPCCRVVINRRGAKRTRADADLSTFLPEPTRRRGEGEEGGEEEEDEGEEEEGVGQPEWQEPEGEEGEEGEEAMEEEEDVLIHDALFKSFETHIERLDAARLRRIETLSFKSALEDDGKEEINEDATLDEIEGLGVWMAGDEFQGDVNMRTLQRLLTRVDQRGFERSAQQLEFHVAFMKVRFLALFLLPVRPLLPTTRPWPAGRRTRNIQRVVGDRAPGHHEALRLGNEQQRSFNFHTAPLRTIVSP